ncbi:MAG: RNA methyltransferase [Bacilli bacterium]|nr:RNA methyltransferase [Bacilli bacterium]MBQ6282339.1 RNA methyltransferase [Bacilli bacterium]
MITSVNNERIKEISKLNNKKYRKERGLFIVEGEHLVEEAYKHDLLVEVYSLNEVSYDNSYIVAESVMKKISNLDSVPNIIGVCKMKEENSLGNKLLILDNIQNPGNLGTIIRSAVAFNVDTIVLSNDTVDLYNSKVIRATEGMIFNINIVTKDLFSFIPSIKDKYKIYGTNVENGTLLKNVKKVEKYAIIMGNEGNGVKRELQDMCDENIYIEMNSLCESLNVGVATSIILYELGR